MKSFILKKWFVLMFAGFIGTTALHAQTRSQGPWWPNALWGANDQSGASNWITPEKILKAVSLVKTGKTFELGHLYERGMPLVGQRSYNIFIPSFPTYPPSGPDSIVFNDEFVTAEIGQVGTQFDGPGHPGRRLTMADGTVADIFYNGIPGAEMRNPYGLQKLGVENVKPIITKGIYIDLAAYKQMNSLPDEYIITMDDIHNTLSRQGIKEADIEPGDALLFNLGWWRFWPGKKTVEGKQPYVNKEVIEWIIAKKPCMVGSDEGLDGPEFHLHEELILKNGIFNLEFMNFESLQSEKQYKFLFILTPIRLKGATGSPCRPLAIF